MLKESNSLDLDRVWMCSLLMIFLLNDNIKLSQVHDDHIFDFL